MPKAKPKETGNRYVVRNPRHIPAGVHILHIGDQVWYEGDDFEPPEGCDTERLVQGGFIQEVE